MNKLMLFGMVFLIITVFFVGSAVAPKDYLILQDENGNIYFMNSEQIQTVIDNSLSGNVTIGGNLTVEGNTFLEDELILEGDARVERELIFKASAVVKGASSPSDDLRAVGSNGGVLEPVVAFSKTTQQDAYGTFHPPSDMDFTENVKLHLMWIPGVAWTSGAYNWSFEYIIKDEVSNISIGTPTTISELITPLNNDHYIETKFTQEIELMTHDDIIVVHFYRDVDDNADDVGEIRFLEIEYVVNSLGESLE